MKYALITVAGRWIGRAICQKLAEMGYYIIVNYLSNEIEAKKTLSLVREVGADGELMQFDVAENTQASRY